MGAVNTVVGGFGGTGRGCCGENTDWVGIKSCIEAGWTGGVEAAVVIGAGAACCALRVLRVRKVYLVSRTRERGGG